MPPGPQDSSLFRMKNSNRNTVFTRFGTLSKAAALFATAATLVLSTNSVWANTTSSSQLIGHPVVTDAGERLGNVEDLAIDPTSGQVSFVVISIGSFLVENSLIAVDANALATVAGGEPMVLRTDDLEVAHRFNADNYPSAADVRAAGSSSSADNGSQDNGSQGDTSSTGSVLSTTGSATITAGNRKATYENGKLEMVNGPMRRTRASGRSENRSTRRGSVIPNFKNVDTNRDGRLSRAEIGAQLNQNSSFDDLDTDANGRIDDFEYAAYLERLASERRWVGNR